MVGNSWVYTVLIRDDLPELITNLISALANVYMYDFPHFVLSPLLRISISDHCKKIELHWPAAGSPYGFLKIWK
jgi:hypothetical protein